MTNDYKELLGKYITGNITPNQTSNIPVFKEDETLTKNITEALQEAFDLEFNTIDFDILTSDTTDNLLLYGRANYESNGSWVYLNFVAVLDEKYNILFTTSKYSSGTPLNQIVKLAYDEEGKVWGIDIGGTTTETGNGSTPRYRLIMLNNVAVPNENGEFEVRLRKSYLFPIGYNKIEDFFLIQKVQGTSLYYILSNNYNSLQSQGRVISVQINVGSSNEWYQTTLSTGGIGEGDNLLIEPEGSDYALYYTSTLANSTDFIKWVKDSTPTKLADINKPVNNPTIISSNQIAFVSIDGVNQTWEFDYWCDGTINTFDTGSLYIFGATKTAFINGSIFYGMTYCDTENHYKVACGCYNGENYATHEYEIGTIANSVLEEKIIMNNNYSLYSIDAMFLVDEANDIIYKTKLTNYIGLYSGAECENYNSLVPKKSELYNSSDELVFARQLYNSTTNKNITTSTVEVPNTFLNNLVIKSKQLIGATSKKLVNDIVEFSKNIYEKLYINFVNTINVIDEDTNTTYQTTATNITTNINSTNEDSTTMENTKIGKVRINFQDNTTKIQTVELTSTGTNEYLIRTTIYVSDAIETIDIISSDETQIYITIDADNLTIGQYYTIEESLRIE